MGLRGGLVHDREYRLNLDVSASCRPGMGRWSITVDGRNEVSRHDVRKDVMVVGNMTMEGRGEGDAESLWIVLWNHHVRRGGCYSSEGRPVREAGQ